MFDRALTAAIGDIERHPRGVMFRRLIRYGPLDEHAPKGARKGARDERGERFTDNECGVALEFVHSQMVNRLRVG